MPYDEMQLENLLICLKCGSRYDSPIILPCGNLICQRCISNIQKLVDCLNGSEFHCQICNQFHEFPPSNHFPTCHQIARFLIQQPQPPQKSKEAKSEPLRSNNINLNLNELNLVDGDFTEFFARLRDTLNSTCEISIQKILDLKKLMHAEIVDYQKECERSHTLIGKYEGLDPEQFHCEWIEKIQSIETMKDTNLSLEDELREKLESEKNRFEEYILENRLLKFSNAVKVLENSFLENFITKKLKEKKIK